MKANAFCFRLFDIVGFGKRNAGGDALARVLRHASGRLCYGVSQRLVFVGPSGPSSTFPLILMKHAKCGPGLRSGDVSSELRLGPVVGELNLRV